ncbi:PREDICTED: gamma-secretase-activating protein [Nanorana parkeri]|uniref:gamma-secretase-activating protein n=1 Tax=Nanorana parkeri TaxID=125878 RepID=UPI000854479C|nr:PREDICTED: gamma-secretase-activating protein [Nanorana parkeri]
MKLCFLDLKQISHLINLYGCLGMDNLAKYSRTLRIVNVERNGNVLYTWKGTENVTKIGLYDFLTNQNEMLYSIDRDVNVISGSVNTEKTLLALSYCNSSCEVPSRVLSPVSKYLALLIEIRPANNLKVLKAVDSSVRVQFLYTDEDKHSSSESRLLIFSEEKYIEQFHIDTENEDKVVIKNSGPILKDRIAEDFVWAQWDMLGQRLFYIIPKRSSGVLHCIQFYPDENFKYVLEVALEISLADDGVTLVNLGYDPPEERGRGRVTTANLQVFTNQTGGLCLFYYQPPKESQDITYTVAFLHKGCSKTFKIATALKEPSNCKLKRLSFINLDGYVAVYLPDHFFHLINTKYPDLMCYHLFLSDEDSRISGMCSDCPMQSLLKSCVLESCTGIIFSVAIGQEKLLKFLAGSRQDCERLAVLHCFLLHLNLHPLQETQIVEWICENVSSCQTFDPIQEFLIASLHRDLSLEATYLDKLLAYTSVPLWNMDIRGVSCTTDIIEIPVMKIITFKGFWEKFYLELEYMKHSQQRFLCSSHMQRRDWCKLISQLDTGEKRNSVYQRNILENAKKVLLNMDTRGWPSDKRTVPLIQEEDYLQKDLMGLMMVKLRDHLSQHLHHVGKNKIEKIVLDFFSKQLDLVCLILEVVWRKHMLDSSVLSFDACGNPSEYFAFHVMCRISEAASRMSMPLPPGFQTLHLVLAMRCLPLGNFLHYIDSGALPLTEAFVVKLLKELDDNAENEKLKYSIIIRLPENISEKVHRLWDHAISNNFIAMKYVRKLLFRLNNKEVIRESLTERSPIYMNFLPLNYLIMMLSEVEDRALNPFEEDNIDAAFLEEIALKRTTVLLGLH